ncbi:MAG: hypothetical protein VB015_01865, partial [Erysipelotrichaceae bacterium]|nr:hypothetical protein [Erysipelotrichaceae bacterium]
MLDNPKNKKRWKIEFKVVLMVFPIVLSSCTFNVPKNSSSDSSSYYESSTNDNNLYTILWQDDDGTPLEVDENVPYGILPTYDGSLPTKQGNEEVVYTFSGWSPSISVVTSNQTYTAVY